MRGSIVVLRELRDEDAEPLAAPFAADPGFGWLIGFEEDPDADFFRQREEPEGFYGRVVADLGTDAPWGFVNLHKHDVRHRRAEIGVWLIPAVHGRGAGAEALQLLCGWGFRALDLVRIQLTTLPENEPMIRCAERVGFVREGVLRSYTFERGRSVDNLMCSLLRSEATWSA